MSGRLYVDGADVYGEYGLHVTESGWNALVAMPPLKDVESNDWHEEDGIEADLSAPVLDTREISVTFAIRGAYSRYARFIDLLSDGAYHEFDCASIGRKYTLRMTSHSSLEHARRLGKAKIKFADDFPLDGYEYEEPVSTLAEDYGYALDGKPFTAYGVRILEGTLAGVLKPAEVKENLLREIDTLAGAAYDGENVTFESKEVKLYCLMRAETLGALWRNYDALLYDLVRPDERLLWVGELKQEFPFHYTSCSVSEFAPEGRPWLKFTLTVTFTSDLRIIAPYPSVRLVNDAAALRLTSGGAARLID